MANKFYEENDISAIASAIRTKLGTQSTFKVSEMASAVTSIPTGGGSGTLEINENGTYNVTDYASAAVSVQPHVGTKTITENGVYNASSDNLDGYSQVTVNTPPFPPELMDVDAFVLESDSTSITIKYDSTKNVAQVMSFLLYNRHIDRNTVYMTSSRKNVYTDEWTNLNYIVASTWNDTDEYGNSNSQYSCTITFDSANETITVTTLSGAFKAGYPYMTMVLYDPYRVESLAQTANNQNDLNEMSNDEEVI